VRRADKTTPGNFCQANGGSSQRKFAHYSRHGEKPERTHPPPPKATARQASAATI
jgi:hypothetical protein